MTEAITIRTFPIDDETISLVVRDRAYFLERDGRNPVALTGLQANELLNSPEKVLLKGESLGINFGPQTGEPLYSRTDLLPGIEEDANAVLLDTSTLNGAAASIENGYMMPLCLLDLSTLTAALLFYDKAIVQPEARFEVDTSLSDAVVTINYPDPEYVSDHLWYHTSLETPARRSGDDLKYGQIWEQALKLESGAVSLQMGAFDKYQDSPPTWDGLFAHSYMHDRVLPNMSDPSLEAQKHRDEFLSIQTMRALFNDRLAGELQVPYLASSLRTPIQSVLLARKVELNTAMDRLLSRLGPRVAKPRDQDSSTYMAPVSAPFALGLVLEKMSEPSDYWEVVCEYRERFSPLRKKLWDDRDEWDMRPDEYAKRFRKFSRKGAKAPEASVRGGLIVGGAVSTSLSSDPTHIIAAMELAGLLAPLETIRKFYYRIFRPVPHLLFSISDEAQALRTVHSRVAAVWDRTWSRDEVDTLQVMASMQDPDFSKLRWLGP